jgi:hypothetical protein
MSQIARLFVVLNLLLAAGFLYAAAMFLGLNHEYKNKYEKATKEAKAAAEVSARDMAAQKTRIDDLMRENQTTKEAKANLEGANARLTNENQEAQKEKAAKDALIAKEQGSVQSANDLAKRAQEDLAKRTDEANKLREASQAAQTAERKANADLEASKTEVRNRDNTIAELEKTKTDQAAKIAEYELMVDVAKRAGVSFEDLAQKQPIANAQVTAVEMSMKMVVVNAGSSQKVSRGALLDIVRGSNYIGRIKIDQVYPNSSAGTLVVAKPGETPQVGDRATNTIN